jgi:hypothetical protein
MEYALRLTAPVAPRGDPRDELPAAWRGLLPGGTTAALYFGSEFCEDRLPDLVEAVAYCELARELGCVPTLQTPLVSPRALRRVDGLLAGLAGEGHLPAVVFNDWGVLRLLRDHHPALPRRAGRLVNRALRDPRAYRDAPEGFATHESSRFVRLRRMLARAGVEAVESDADLTGGYLGEGQRDADAPLARALHVPFTFAATGRACPLKAGLCADGGFTKALADLCPAPCRGKPLPIRRDDTALPHWRGGNTLFYELPSAAARSWLSHAERVVVHAAAAP